MKSKTKRFLKIITRALLPGLMLCGMANSTVAQSSSLPNPTRIASYGPNGTHWPSIIPTPFMYDSTVANIIEVDCSWTAISTAIGSLTVDQVDEGVLILVRPGTLKGKGSGSTSTPVLQNLGSADWPKRVTVAPRDGYGTVTIDGTGTNDPKMRINQVHSVCFAGFVAGSINMTNCKRSALAWIKLTSWMSVGSTGGNPSYDMEVVEVVMPNHQHRDTDIAQSPSSASGGDISNYHYVGCYLAPAYRQASSAHTDTLQFFGSGSYSNMYFKDSALFASSNCAIQTGALDGLVLDHTYIASHPVSTTRYPFLETDYISSANNEAAKVLNGGGQNFQAHDSIFIGGLGYSGANPWIDVSNTRVSTGNPPALSQGSWTIDSTLTQDMSDMPPEPTDAYLISIWSPSSDQSITITDLADQQTVLMGAEGFSLTATITGAPTPACQWQVSTNSGITWSDILSSDLNYYGGNTTTLTFMNITTDMDGYYYRYVASNSFDSATSNALTLIVQSNQSSLPKPTRVASYGPNGTHWPSIIPTPFMYDDTIANTIEVDCSWTAISTAIGSLTVDQVDEGVLILVRPGTLKGKGSGSTSTPVLQNLGSADWPKRVTVAPRDGYGTVTIDGTGTNDPKMRINQVHSVCFAGFVAGSINMTNCKRSALAWIKLTSWMSIGSTGGNPSYDMEMVEVVMPNHQHRDTDTAQSPSSASGGDISNYHYVGCYFAPAYRQTSSAHTDTFQFFGSGSYANMYFKDSALFASSNCAIQTGSLDGLVLDHTYIASDPVSTTRYPFIASDYISSANNEAAKVLNGGGQNFQAYDSILIGGLGYSGANPWIDVSNTRISTGNPPALSQGSWTIDSTLTQDMSDMPSEPTDTYLNSIWQQ